MPRYPRILSSTGIYQIMTRGINKTDIFLDDEDKVYYLNILIDAKKKYSYLIYAYCIMNNHVHLLIKTEVASPVSDVMKSINIRYSFYFNKKYGRTGHLFQNRFKSEPVVDEHYYLTVVDYIHNNPVKAEMTNSPYEYKWSSYRNGTVLEPTPFF